MRHSQLSDGKQNTTSKNAQSNLPAAPSAVSLIQRSANATWREKAHPAGSPPSRLRNYPPRLERMGKMRTC